MGIRKQHNFHLIIKEETFYVNNSGNVIGEIFFEIDDVYFPELNWYDFAVRILSWLTENIVSVKQNNKESMDTPFMEGPFKVKFQLEKTKRCKIDFIEGEQLAGDKEIIHKTITIPLGEVIDEVTKACEMIIRMRESKELEFENDYEELLEAYHSLTRTSSS